jgi:adenosylcobinamide hydrolase
VFSRFQGDHWVEWIPEQCPYYPCHVPGQRCEFCYCPFYPCKDETLGQWVKSTSKNGPVWNCSGCTLLHEPLITEYLLAHPEAPLAELKRKKGIL